MTRFDAAIDSGALRAINAARSTAASRACPSGDDAVDQSEPLGPLGGQWLAGEQHFHRERVRQPSGEPERATASGGQTAPHFG